MPIYTFRCSNGHEYDEIVAYGVEQRRCPLCDENGNRTFSEIPAKRNPDYGIQR